MTVLGKLAFTAVPLALLPEIPAVAAGPARQGKAGGPHIVFLLADDMGYGDVSAFNAESRIRTENIDRMAENGIMFTDAHSPSAVSTPTRYGLMTGRYSWRSTLKSGVLKGWSHPLIVPGRKTMADMLKECGYETACIGKWHLGWNWGTRDGVTVPENRDFLPEEVDFSRPITEGPTTKGFDLFYGFCGSLDMPPYVYVENDRATSSSVSVVEKGRKPGFWRAGIKADDFSHQGCLSHLCDKAVEYIIGRKGSGRPFFLYLPLPAPHTPILPSDRFRGRSGIGSYGDYTLMVDEVVGRIRAALKAIGAEDHTLLVFTTDNGCSPAADLPELEGYGHHPSYIWRGHKADLFEGGHRVPTIVEWADGGRGICSETICLTDFYATFAELNGYRTAPAEAEDSFSLLSLLKNPDTRTFRRGAVVHHSSNGEFAIRKGRWKLLCSPSSGGWSWPRPGKDDDVIATLPTLQLYDLESDPGERNNVYAEHPEVVRRLYDTLMKYIRDGRSAPGKPSENEGGRSWRKVKLTESYYSKAMKAAGRRERTKTVIGAETPAG